MNDAFFLSVSFILVFCLLRLYIWEKEKKFQKKLKKSLKESFGLINIGLTASKTIHEVNNLLALSYLSLELLARKNFKRKQKKEALKDALRCLKKIKKILQTNQEQNSQEREKNFFPPAEQIEKALIFLRPKIKKTNTNVDKKMDRKIKIWGNSVKFYQLVSNLLLNSLEAYELQLPKDKQGVLIIRLKNEKKKLTLLIKDEAGGIAKEKASKIFDLFFTTKTQGSGLGLFICKEIVENDFSGKITLKTQKGEGTTFKLTMPIKGKK